MHAVELTKRDLARLGLTSADALRYLDGDYRNIMLAAYFKKFRLLLEHERDNLGGGLKLTFVDYAEGMVTGPKE